MNRVTPDQFSTDIYTTKSTGGFFTKGINSKLRISYLSFW